MFSTTLLISATLVSVALGQADMSAPATNPECAKVENWGELRVRLGDGLQPHDATGAAVKADEFVKAGCPKSGDRERFRDRRRNPCPLGRLQHRLSDGGSPDSDANARVADLAQQLKDRLESSKSQIDLVKTAVETRLKAHVDDLVMRSRDVNDVASQAVKTVANICALQQLEARCVEACRGRGVCRLVRRAVAAATTGGDAAAATVADFSYQCDTSAPSVDMSGPLAVDPNVITKCIIDAKGEAGALAGCQCLLGRCPGTTPPVVQADACKTANCADGQQCQLEKTVTGVIATCVRPAVRCALTCPAGQQCVFEGSVDATAGASTMMSGATTSADLAARIGAVLRPVCKPVDACATVKCAAGTVCTRNDAGAAQCVDVCTLRRCAAGYACQFNPMTSAADCLPPMSQCQPACTTGQVCRAAADGSFSCRASIELNPCATKMCADNTVCQLSRNGTLIATAVCVPKVDACATVHCSVGTRCVDGQCRSFVDPCNAEPRPCPNQLCMTTVNEKGLAPVCSPLPVVTTCVPACGTGSRCTNGVCVTDPCAAVKCATGTTCRVTRNGAECVGLNVLPLPGGMTKRQLMVDRANLFVTQAQVGADAEAPTLPSICSRLAASVDAGAMKAPTANMMKRQDGTVKTTAMVNADVDGKALGDALVRANRFLNTAGDGVKMMLMTAQDQLTKLVNNERTRLQAAASVCANTMAGARANTATSSADVTLRAALCASADSDAMDPESTKDAVDLRARLQAFAQKARAVAAAVDEKAQLPAVQARIDALKARAEKCKALIAAAKPVADAGISLRDLINDDGQCKALRDAAVKCQAAASADASASAGSDASMTVAMGSGRVKIDAKCVPDAQQLAAARTCWNTLIKRRQALIDAARKVLTDADCLRPRKCVPFDGERRRFVLHQFAGKDEPVDAVLNRLKAFLEARIERKQNDGTQMGDQTPDDVETKPDGTVVKRDSRPDVKRTWPNLAALKTCLELRIHTSTPSPDSPTTADVTASIAAAKDCAMQQMMSAGGMTRKRAEAQLAGELDNLVLDVATAVEVSKESSNAPVDESVPTDDYQGFEVDGADGAASGTTTTLPKVDDTKKDSAASLAVSALVAFVMLIVAAI